MLNIPKETKLSYFLKPAFLNSILEYLLDVNERVSKTGHQPLTINEEINTLKKSSLESFLDIVSIEFNKHDRWKLFYNDDPDQEIDNEKEKKEIDNTMLFQVEILNKFLTQIDVEILLSWSNSVGACDDNENYDINAISKHLFKNAKSLIWNINTSENDNGETPGEVDGDFKTLKKREILKYEKKPIRDEFNIEKKIPSEIYNLEMVDLLDLIDQLYLFMSVIFCIGVLGKREAWGKAQVCFSDEPYKSILKKWCNMEEYNKYLDLDGDNKEDAKSTISLNLHSAFSGNAGWMNVSGTINSSTDPKLLRELESLRNQVKEVEHLREEVKETNNLRDQIQEIEMLREQVKEVEELKNQVKEINELRDQVKMIKRLKEEVRGAENLKQQVKEIESFKLQIVELKKQVNEANKLKMQNKELEDLNTKLLNENESQEVTHNSLKEVISELKKAEEDIHNGNEKIIKELQNDHQLHIHEYQLEINELNQTIKQLKQEIVKNSNEENKIKAKYEKQFKDQEKRYILTRKELMNEKENIKNNEREKEMKELVEKIKDSNSKNAKMQNDLETYKLLLENIYQGFIELKNKFILSNTLRSSEITQVVSELEKIEHILDKDDEHQIKRVDNFKDLVRELSDNYNYVDYKEFTIRIHSNNKIEFINSQNELIEVDKLSLEEGKKIEVKFNLEFLMNLLNEREEIEEIRLLYKKVLVEQLNKYLLLKNCCKVLRERNLEYIDKSNLLVERDHEVWSWYKISDKRFNENRIQIEKLIYDIEINGVGRDEVLFELKLISEEIKINLDAINLDTGVSNRSIGVTNGSEKGRSRVTSVETRMEV